MIKIYHNARCGKSREGLKVLEQSGQDFEVKEYLKEPISEEELKQVMEKLKIAPIELVRTEEKIWKERYKGKDLNDDEVIRVMIENPKLIQRPIVVKNNEAVVGRPASKILSLIKEQ